MISSVPDEILSHCKQTFGDVFSFQHASGGCINNGGMLETQKGRIFLKWNRADLYPDMFAVEAQGLALLAGSKALKVPDVLSVYGGEKFSCLILEYIDSAAPAAGFWNAFGTQLAQIHKQQAEHYGLDHNNYMGSLQQVNDKKNDVITFFTACRLKPQLELARKHNKIDVEALTLFDKLINKLPELLVDDKPSLIHGDLWSGNFMVGSTGEPVLIDPAVAYGHREMDLAMTRLFGGFNKEFYEAYHEAFPLQAGFADRFEIYNLYPLLIHVNLFGEGYMQQTLQIVKKYI